MANPGEAAVRDRGGIGDGPGAGSVEAVAVGGERFDLGSAGAAPGVGRRRVLKAAAGGVLGGLLVARAARPAAAAFEEGWRFCQKCRCLHWPADGTRGPCPAGGRHSVQGSLRYRLAYDVGEGPLQEGGWRYCGKCRVLHFVPDGKGTCAAGGRHSVDRAFKYVVSVNFPPEPGLQGGWRHCTKCRSLHFAGDGTRGPCPDRGRHDKAGHFGDDYQVLYQQ